MARASAWILGAAALGVGCAPPAAELRMPRTPPGTQVQRDQLALTCRGRHERLACRAVVEAEAKAPREAQGPPVVARREEEVILAAEPEPLGWLVTPGPIARHPMVADALGHHPCRYRGDGCRLRLGVRLTPREARAPAHRFEVVAALPEGVAYRIGRAAYQSPSLPDLVLAIDTPPAQVAPGGPFVLVGSELGHGGLAMRAGWELFAPLLAAHRFSLERSARGEATLAYGLSLVMPSLAFLPSLGLGLGLPLRLWSARGASPALGTRLEASLTFPRVGLSGGLWADLFPGDEDPTSVSLAAGLSL
ncbi:MAG: hypothetical protein KC731_42260 [Myxococcales bacterium]|nr:hypothetical protein [Myxococcales bacterium]